MINTDILCNPYLGEPLKRIGNNLVGVASGNIFAIKDDIPKIISKSHFSNRNKFHKFAYDISSGYYEQLIRLGDKIKYSQDLSVNKMFLEKLNFDKTNSVLEVGIGAGYSTKFLPNEIEHIGLDISWLMLKRAKLNMLANNREPKLIQSLAEYIPFKNNKIDLVFQIGTLQFTEDPFKTVSEMARVAMPGSKIYIIDEVRGGLNIFKRSPAHMMHVKSKDDLILELPRLVPHSMQNIQSKLLPGGQYYQLQFTKPLKLDR